MGRGYERLERLRAALISLREVEVRCTAALEAKRQDVQNAIKEIKQTGGDVLGTNDEELTPAEMRAKKIVLWHQCCSDIEPILHYIRASQRILGAQDLEKSVADILYELLNAVRQEFDPE